MSHPLLTRLFDEFDVVRVNSVFHDPTLDSEDTWVLFFPGPMQRYPESLDVAVILPEILKQSGQPLRAACAEEEVEEGLRKRFPFDFYPALVFVKHGVMLDSICKVQDWSVYLDRLTDITQKAQQLIPMQTTTVESNHAGL